MRIVIAAPRKTGNARLRCLLASMYGLTPMNSRETVNLTDADEIAAWLAELPDSSVTNAGFAYSGDLVQETIRSNVTVLAIFRHPFDLFVSNYDVAQQRAIRDKKTASPPGPWSVLAGHALADSATLDYARSGFADEIAWLRGWHGSGAPVIRYEQLELDPVSVLTDLALRLGPLEPGTISRAVTLCPSENAVVSRPERGRRVPPLLSGAWRERLPAATMDLLNDAYANDVIQLGYDTT